MNRFKEGDEAAGLFFEDDGELSIEYANVESITCVMENGQMAGVPWFAVKYTDGSTIKWNAALLGGVKLLPKKEDA
jgi:hypothetical protein